MYIVNSYSGEWNDARIWYWFLFSFIRVYAYIYESMKYIYIYIYVVSSNSGEWNYANLEFIFSYFFRTNSSICRRVVRDYFAASTFACTRILVHKIELRLECGREGGKERLHLLCLSLFLSLLPGKRQAPPEEGGVSKKKKDSSGSVVTFPPVRPTLGWFPHVFDTVRMRENARGCDRF